MDLVSYIFENLKKGYSIDEIRETLLSNRIPEKKIGEAIAKYTVRTRVANFITGELGKGSGITEIVTFLQKEGYHEDDIYNALIMLNLQAQAAQVHITHMHTIHISAKTAALGMIFIILFGITGYLLISSAKKNPSELLDLRLEKISVDAKLVRFWVFVENKGMDEDYDITIRHRLVDSRENNIDEKKSTHKIEEDLAIEESMESPKTPGRYFIVSDVRYGKSQIAESSFSFEILPAVKNITNKTKDNRTNASVINDTGKIEEIQRQINDSSSDPLEVCRKDRLFMDNCYYEYALKRTNSSICENIMKVKWRDQCYIMIFLETKDIVLCDRIETSEIRVSCRRLSE